MLLEHSETGIGYSRQMPSQNLMRQPMTDTCLLRDQGRKPQDRPLSGNIFGPATLPVSQLGRFC